jgi:hypothetical protein
MDEKIVFVKSAKADGRRQYGINKMPRQIQKTYFEAGIAFTLSNS